MTLILVAQLVPSFVLAGGAVVLIVHQRRAPRAAVLALPFVMLLAVLRGLEPAWHLAGVLGVRPPLPPPWSSQVYLPAISLVWLTFPVVMVVAAMRDRVPGRRDATA